MLRLIAFRRYLPYQPATAGKPVQQIIPLTRSKHLASSLCPFEPDAYQFSIQRRLICSPINIFNTNRFSQTFQKTFHEESRSRESQGRLTGSQTLSISSRQVVKTIDLAQQTIHVAHCVQSIFSAIISFLCLENTTEKNKRRKESEKNIKFENLV